MKNKIPLVALLCLFGFSGNSAVASPIGTAFTYQGHLMIATQPGNGFYDFQFTLFDEASNGTIVAEPITHSSVSVSNGLFTVALDFGAAAFGDAARWLELAARSNGSGGFSTLAPRQNLTPTPYAFHAANISSSALAGVYSNAVSFTNPGSSFAGNGVNLTNIPAAAVTGLAQALNYLTNNSGWDGPALSAALSSGTNSFGGDGTGLTNLLRTVGWLNVADFGAIPNDNISDTLAIQAAIDAAALNGGVVFFPPGEFTIGAERPYPSILDGNSLSGHLMILSNNITLQGSGRDLTILRRVGGGRVANFVQTAYSGATNFSMFDMTLDAGHTLTYNMTSIYNCDNQHYERTRWQNHDDDALEISGGLNVTIRNSIFTNIAANAVAFVPVWNALIEGCWFSTVGFNDPTNYTAAPYHFPGNWAAIQVRNGSYKIANSVVTNSGTAIQHAGGDLRVDNCNFYSSPASLTNIYLISGPAVFANCFFQQFGNGLSIYAGPVAYAGGSGNAGSGGHLDAGQFPHPRHRHRPAFSQVRHHSKRVRSVREHSQPHDQAHRPDQSEQQHPHQQRSLSHPHYHPGGGRRHDHRE